MCWKYEDEYGGCLDLIFKDYFWQDKDGLDELLRNWSIEIKAENHIEYELLFFDFLTKCHESGYFTKCNKYT
jgi:hypothetical protein